MIKRGSSKKPNQLDKISPINCEKAIEININTNNFCVESILLLIRNPIISLVITRDGKIQQYDSFATVTFLQQYCLDSFATVCDSQQWRI